MSSTTLKTSKFSYFPAASRGLSQMDWLTSYHSLSFNDYRNELTPFSCLRVMNDDIVAPGGGFATHGHQDMEIVTLVLSGELQHKDSLGNGSVIQAGDVQRMTAGTGIRHSEFNPSDTQPVHLYQIWFTPETTGLVPSYEQIPFHESERVGRWCLIVSPDSRSGSVRVNQDVFAWVRQFSESELGTPITFETQTPRAIWLQVLSGEVTCGAQALTAGDAMYSYDASHLELTPLTLDSNVMVFDLPPAA